MYYSGNHLYQDHLRPCPRNVYFTYMFVCSFQSTIRSLIVFVNVYFAEFAERGQSAAMESLILLLQLLLMLIAYNNSPYQLFSHLSLSFKIHGLRVWDFTGLEQQSRYSLNRGFANRHMYGCMCVYIYIYMYISIYTHICIHSTSMYIYIYI